MTQKASTHHTPNLPAPRSRILSFQDGERSCWMFIGSPGLWCHYSVRLSRLRHCLCNSTQASRKRWREKGSVLVRRNRAPCAWVAKAALGLPGLPVPALCLQGLAFQEETAGLCWKEAGMTNTCCQHCHGRASRSLCGIHSRGGALGLRAGAAAEATLLLG